MDPEENFAAYQQEYIKNVVKGAKNMARVRFSIFDRHNNKTRTLDFKVYIQIWQDDDWDYAGHLEYVKNLVETGVELNTNSYKAMSDQLYILIATDMPNREIWIVINSNDIGLTTKYDQKT